MIVFYVSGHGYGHATRIAAVMAAISRMRPDLRIAVRTQAARMLFPECAEYHDVDVDSAAVEGPDALTVDMERSVAGIRTLLARADAIIRREVCFLWENKARVIAADVPFLAGEIARRSGLPGIAMSNFLWDWIFDGCAGPDVRERVRHGYSGLRRRLFDIRCHTERAGKCSKRFRTCLW